LNVTFSDRKKFQIALQLTWMRRMEGVTLIDRGGRTDAEVADEIVDRLNREEG